MDENRSVSMMATLPIKPFLFQKKATLSPLKKLLLATALLAMGYWYKRTNAGFPYTMGVGWVCTLEV